MASIWLNMVDGRLSLSESAQLSVCNMGTVLCYVYGMRFVQFFFHSESAGGPNKLNKKHCHDQGQVNYHCHYPMI